MMVDVFMRDGQTVFRFQKRSAAVDALKRDPVDLGRAELGHDAVRNIFAWVRWQRQNDWEPVGVQQISRGSVAFVTAVPRDEAEAFQAALAAERAAASA